MTVDSNLKMIFDILRQQLPAGACPPSMDADFTLTEAGLDSLKTVAFFLRLEESFGLRFETEDLDAANFRTVGSVLALVTRRLGAGR
jgi:acyl carrier protein